MDMFDAEKNKIRWDKAPCRFCGVGCGVINVYWSMCNNNVQAAANMNKETLPGYRNPDNSTVDTNRWEMDSRLYIKAKAGYTFDFWKTRLGVEYDYSSGDATPTTGNHKTFVFPFHTNHAHYGEMDFFS
ncbi:MAG: alginate export family protein [Mariprofundus sp.]|nr:alginate export family protein [Mariprofundus sp.]